MHLIKDENGNLIPHGNEHTHEHSHDQAAGTNKTLVLMQYMLDHNEHHTDELAQMAKTLGENEAAAVVMEAVEEFIKGNEKLAQAIELMQNT